MTDFSATTPFRLVRALATAGRDSPSLYMLIAEGQAIPAVQDDLAAEVEVQLGSKLRSLSASEELPKRLDSPVVLVTLDQWMPRLVEWLDLHVVLLTQSGAVLLLTDGELAERVLSSAPNLRNRLSDVLKITPDEAFGGATVEH